MLTHPGPKGNSSPPCPALMPRTQPPCPPVKADPPASKVLPGTRRGTDDGGEGGSHQQGEEHQVEQTLHPVVADTDEGVQVVLQQEMGWGRAGDGGG